MVYSCSRVLGIVSTNIVSSGIETVFGCLNIFQNGVYSLRIIQKAYKGFIKNIWTPIPPHLKNGLHDQFSSCVCFYISPISQFCFVILAVHIYFIHCSGLGVKKKGKNEK